MTTALPMMLDNARLPKCDLTHLKDMLDGRLHMSRRQRRDIEDKIQLREMEGHVFAFAALFAQPEAWVYNSEIGRGSVRVPTIGFAGIKDEVATFEIASKYFVAHGEHHYTLQPRESPMSYSRLTTRTPYIPKKLMPRWGTRYEYFVIFDVPKWERVQTVQMEDPYIVRRVSDDHFKVVAHWDLSENEKKLMQFATSR